MKTKTIKEIIRKEISSLDDLIMNLEYELNEIKHTEDEKIFINSIIEEYARIRQKLIVKDEES